MKYDFVRWLIVAAAASAACMAGCNREPPSAPAVSDQQSSQEVVAEAEALMENVQTRLQRPTSNAKTYEQVVKQLNEYLGARNSEVPSLDSSIAERVGKMLGGDGASAVDRKTFDEADADYLDNALFLQAVAKSLRRDDDDLKYAERLFDWVARYVQLTPTGSLPEGRPKSVCIRGNGSIDERAWVFLELLRQAGIGGCRVGVPKATVDGPISPWLCGALVGKEIRLFDPRLGVPLPGAGGGIATLKELAANPALSDFLQLPAPTPAGSFSKADARNFSLLVAVEPPMLAPRMRFLQEKLSGANRPNLFLDIDKAIAELSGCLEGVGENQGVRIWKYPQNITTKLHSDRQASMMLLGSLNAYWLQTGRSPRLMQLRGDHRDAVKELVKLDLEKTGDVLAAELAGIRLPQEVSQRIISQTRQDIVYFIGLSKLDDPQGNPGASIDWFDRYLEKYSSPTLRMDDFLNWPLFAADVAGILGAEPGEKPHVNVMSPLIRKRLSKASQDAVKKIADDFQKIRAIRIELAQRLADLAELDRETQEAGGSEQLKPLIAEQQKQVQVRRDEIERIEGPNASLKLKIIDELNAMLAERSFFDAQAFAPLLDASDELKAIAKQASTLTPKELTSLNRGLFDAAYPAAVIKNQRYWLAGAMRNRATAFARDGKTAEAIASIEKNLKEAPAFDRINLMGYANYLRAQPAAAK